MHKNSQSIHLLLSVTYRYTFFRRSYRFSASVVGGSVVKTICKKSFVFRETGEPGMSTEWKDNEWKRGEPKVS